VTKRHYDLATNAVVKVAFNSREIYRMLTARLSLPGMLSSLWSNTPSADGCLTIGASCLYYSFRKSENFTKELLQLYDSLSSLIYPPRLDGILNERD